MTHLKAVLSNSSRGHYGRDMAETIRDAARCSVGSVMPAKSLELKHTIRLIRELDAEIKDIENAIQAIMDEIQSPITTIPGKGVRMGAVFLAEIGDFSRFDSPDEILDVAFHLPVRAAFAVWSLLAHGKTRFPLFALRHLQRHEIRLPLGPDLCRLPCQETGRGEALQRCALSCGKEIGTSDFCNGEISAAILRRSITPIFHKLK